MRLAHDEVRELLPWWANRTLEPDERRAVEHHLARCAACRAEAADERRLAALFDGAGEAAAPLPHPRCFDRLMERLDRDEERAAVAPSPALAPATARHRKIAPETLRRLVAVEAAALLVLAVALAVVLLRDPPPAAPVGADPAAGMPTAAAPAFRTLGADPGGAATEPGTRRLRVVFAADAPEAALRELLLEIRGRLIDGPSPLGAYTVAVPAGPADEPLALILEHLRSRPEVRLAEPVATVADGGGG